MNKRLVKVLVTYGKHDGEEVAEEFIINDSKEAREYLFDEFNYIMDVIERGEEFLAKESDTFYGNMYGGDWDEPTGRQVIIYSKDELLGILKSDYDSEVRKVEHLFSKEAMY